MVFLNPYAFVTGKAVLHFSAIVYHGHAQVHQPYDGKVFLNIKHPHKLRFAGNHISAPQSVQSTRHVLIGFQASRIVWTGQFLLRYVIRLSCDTISSSPLSATVGMDIELLRTAKPIWLA